MDKFFYNVIYVLIALALLFLFEKIFRNRKDNPTLNKIYKIIVTIFWIIAAIVTVLLYWAGYKIYTTFGNKNERN